MAKIQGAKSSFTFDPSEVKAYSRQGQYILVSFQNGGQHNIPCLSEQEAITLEGLLDKACANLVSAGVAASSPPQPGK